MNPIQEFQGENFRVVSDGFAWLAICWNLLMKLQEILFFERQVVY